MNFALKIISASEIAAVMPEFTYDWADNNPRVFQDTL
jgi:phosphoribosylpyrophosphate synthetase